MDSEQTCNSWPQMEAMVPPMPPAPMADGPRLFTSQDSAESRLNIVAKSIAGAASLFRKSCQGGDSYLSNCANFLSEAFIRAGYTELNPPSECINARCETTAKRPVRAWDMWCWFKSIATETRESLPKNEGFWAVFQLKADEYWGGHVVIIHTVRNIVYGTGNYPHWAQYCYKW